MKRLGARRGVLLAGLVFAIPGFVVACAKHQPIKTSIKPVSERIYAEAAQRAEGAIWQGDSPANQIFVDSKARQPGDIVTILVEETTTSSQTATTSTSRDSSVDFSTGRLLGLPSNLGIQNFLGMGNSFNPNLDSQTSLSHDGQGTTTRNGSITATITAVVTEILPSGNMTIEGRRSVIVNNEEQTMVLTGIIRPRDINFDNTISSRFIADAAITLTGEGVIADEQRVGWGSRLLAWIWPF